jgi:hypothetical protein
MKSPEPVWFLGVSEFELRVHSPTATPIKAMESTEAYPFVKNFKVKSPFVGSQKQAAEPTDPNKRNHGKLKFLL